MADARFAKPLDTQLIDQLVAPFGPHPGVPERAADSIRAAANMALRDDTRALFMKAVAALRAAGPVRNGELEKKMLEKFDTDKDGTLSAEELKSAPDALLGLDKNADGELSPQELVPHGPPPAGRPDGESGGPK